MKITLKRMSKCEQVFAIYQQAKTRKNGDMVVCRFILLYCTALIYILYYILLHRLHFYKYFYMTAGTVQS